MLDVDSMTLFLALAVVIVVFLLVDFLFAGGGMTGSIMGAAAQCSGAMMASPYGWAIIVALVIIVLAAFGILFSSR